MSNPDKILINGETSLYGIIGNPIKHSFSPSMHTAAFQAMNQNAVYLPFLIDEGKLPTLLDAFALLNVKGFNVTVPFKQKIIPFLSDIDPDAALLNSVNTVIRTTSGWKGYSTDGAGFIRSLNRFDFQLEHARISLIGAGGSARAIAISLVNAGVKEISIYNRTESNAKDLVELIEGVSSNITTRINPDIIGSIDLLINCTTLGMVNDKCPVSDEMINSSKIIVDIIYNPAITPLLDKARKHSIPNQNGIGMLLYQGIEAFEIWTNLTAPVDVMKESLLQSLNIT